MKQPRSFATTLKVTITATIAVTVTIYTLTLMSYLYLSQKLIVDFTFDSYAYAAAEQVARDPSQPLPDAYGIKTYLGFHTLPIELQVAIDEPHEPGLGAVFFDKVDLPPPPGPYVVFVFFVRPLEDGRFLYLVKGFEDEAEEHIALETLEALNWATLPVALGFIALFVYVSWWVGGRLTRPSERLAAWVRDAPTSGLDQPPPDFEYQELNHISGELYGSLVRIDRFIARERDFLRHASHELRTPITVINGSVSVLKRQSPTDPQARSITRIERAAKGMGLLIETLLWLGREKEGIAAPAGEAVRASQMVRDVVADLAPLADGRKVTVTLDIEESDVLVAPGPAALIVAANLVRNAFQHTPQGQVLIHLKGRKLIVENRFDRPVAGAASETPDGIGLSLVRRVCKRCGWIFHSEVLAEGGFKAVFEF